MKYLTANGFFASLVIIEYQVYNPIENSE